MKSSLQILIGIALLILAVALAIHLTITQPAKELGEAVIHAGEQTVTHGIDKTADVLNEIPQVIATVFQARVNISSSASICDATPIAELAVLKRNIREIVDYSNTDYYSTKRIVAEQTFVAKIGFDLAARFSASFNPSNNTVTIALPNPKVLSLEPVNPAPRYYVDDSGIINRLTTDDHQQILIQLRNQAAQSAESALAVGDARQMIETRFRDLFHAFNVKVVVVFPGQPTNLVAPPLPAGG
ncbi:MAG TPA: DUF4230 domain-containing protein [Candidatus Acidoferrales bacterium]|nr:DUF4230 domain-containing protein [Candidatus Acidoferrales bacterium]